MNTPLDQQLKTWADRTAAPPEHLDSLANRVRKEIVRERIHAVTRGHQAHWHHILYVVAGAAAAFVITFLWFSSNHGEASDGACMASAAASADISTDRLEAAARLVGEMNRLFDENWRWVTESNGDMNMGIARLQGGVGSDTQSMIVRVSLAAKENGGQPWHQVWHSDIVLRSEEAVEITPNHAHENSLAFWVLPLANGSLQVDANISLTSPLRFSSRDSTIVQDGQPSELASFTRGTTHYKLFQTVKLLAADGKESV
ncbi:MAG: hypothetical protein HQ523_16310 [Lentisphaerae bacterium]|nr:hypothetical protein [Lentisphaerota bacterium]